MENLKPGQVIRSVAKPIHYFNVVPTWLPREVTGGPMLDVYNLICHAETERESAAQSTSDGG